MRQRGDGQKLRPLDDNKDGLKLMKKRIQQFIQVDFLQILMKKNLKSLCQNVVLFKKIRGQESQKLNFTGQRREESRREMEHVVMLKWNR